jgi:hypothetical protein
MLLERQPALDALSTLREQAAAGRGQVALLAAPPMSPPPHCAGRR